MSRLDKFIMTPYCHRLGILHDGIFEFNEPGSFTYSTSWKDQFARYKGLRPDFSRKKIKSALRADEPLSIQLHQCFKLFLISRKHPNSLGQFFRRHGIIIDRPAERSFMQHSQCLTDG